MAHHKNKFGDGSKLIATRWRASMYKPQQGYGENIACLSDKRTLQVAKRMYRGFWNG